MPIETENRADDDDHEQLILLDAQDLTDLLKGEEVTTQAANFNEDGDPEGVKTQVINRSGSPSWISTDESESPGPSEGQPKPQTPSWKLHLFTLFVMAGAAAVTAYFGTLIPFEDVLVGFSATDRFSFWELFGMLSVVIVLVQAIQHAPDYIRARQKRGESA